MKDFVRRNLFAMMAILFLFVMTASSGYSIQVTISSSADSAIWEDVILFTSVGGDAPRFADGLGDIDLDNGTLSFGDIEADPAVTAWWLIGHIGDHVAYTSVMDLSSTDLSGVNPYLGWDVFSLADIITNLENYANGDAVSFDWWGATATLHGDHVALDGETATLWQFTEGTNIATVGVAFDGTTPPPPIIPEPMTLGLMGIGLSGLALIRRRHT